MYIWFQLKLSDQDIFSVSFFFSHFLLLFKYSCLHCPPTTHPPAMPTSHPWSYPSLALSLCPLYMFLKTLPHFSPIIPSNLPSGYCQYVLFFNVSGYFLLVCLFCWQASTYRWDHMVYVFHCLAICMSSLHGRGQWKGNWLWKGGLAA